jgi:hypothetical protein
LIVCTPGTNVLVVTKAVPFDPEGVTLAAAPIRVAPS